MTNTDKNDLNATIGNTVLCDGFLIPMTDFVKNKETKIKEKIISIMMAETFTAYGRPHGTAYTVIESEDFDKIADSILEILYSR